MQSRFHPYRAASHVLQDERGRHGDTGDEAAARKVVPAQEQEDCRYADHRKQQPHHQRCSSHRILCGVALLAIGMRVVINVLGMLLFGNGNAFGRRTEAAQQRIDSQCYDREHGDLAQCIEAAEIHEDDVHYVGSAALCVSVLDEIPRNAVRSRTLHHRQCEGRQSDACEERDGEVANAVPSHPVDGAGWANLRDAFWQPSQTEQQ